MSRYIDRNILTNESRKYKSTFEKRGLIKMLHYDTPKHTYPTAAQISTLEMSGHTWKVGDRFYKLAYEAYGDSTLWWIIAWFNKTPTEADINNGDVIQIPFPLERILQYLET